MSLVKATEKTIRAAVKAGKLSRTDDAGPIQALILLARKIDAWDEIVAFALADAADMGGRPAVPQNDNVSLASYLKYCESLGLTPAAQAKKPDAKKDEGKPKSKLAAVRESRDGSAA